HAPVLGHRRRHRERLRLGQGGRRLGRVERQRQHPLEQRVQLVELLAGQVVRAGGGRHGASFRGRAGVLPTGGPVVRRSIGSPRLGKKGKSGACLAPPLWSFV